MKDKISYSTAFANLQDVVRQIENEEIQLDTLAEKVKEANELINFCESKLRTIAGEVGEAKA